MHRAFTNLRDKDPKIRKLYIKSQKPTFFVFNRKTLFLSLDYNLKLV